MSIGTLKSTSVTTASASRLDDLTSSGSRSGENGGVQIFNSSSTQTLCIDICKGSDSAPSVTPTACLLKIDPGDSKFVKLAVDEAVYGIMDSAVSGTATILSRNIESERFFA